MVYVLFLPSVHLGIPLDIFLFVETLKYANIISRIDNYLLFITNSLHTKKNKIMHFLSEMTTLGQILINLYNH